MRRLVTVFAVLLLLTAFCLPAAAAPDELPPDSVVLDTPNASCPQDQQIAGDLVLTGNCPREVVLINVQVGGAIRVEAEHAVTVRLQGSSSCAKAVIDTAANLYGRGWKDVSTSAPLLQMFGNADRLTLTREDGLCVLDGSVSELILAAPGIAVGGSGQADTARLQAVNCAADILCGSVEQEASEAGTVQAEIVATPVVNPASSVIEATVTFTNVPAQLEGDYRLQWYFGRTQVSLAYHFDLRTGQTSSITCSAHFPELEGDTIPVWVQLTPISREGEPLRFGTQVAYTVQKATVLDVKYPYAIEINRQQCTILVYALDENGEYTRLVQCFLCSVGRNKKTPLGTFSSGAKHRWHQLMGNVFGQYTSQIHGNVLFHSVPNYQSIPSTLEWDQYNKLGNPASAGCVRVCVQDVKWIYDNCVPGTSVRIYDDDNLPVVKPIPITIDENYTYRGWDPTDPNPDNPTHATNPMAPLTLYSLRPLRAEPYVK